MTPEQQLDKQIDEEVKALKEVRKSIIDLEQKLDKELLKIYTSINKYIKLKEVNKQ